MLRFAVIVVALVACKKEENVDFKQMEEDVKVEFARDNVAEIDRRLASRDPSSAASMCYVIKPNMAAIQKADPKLAATIEKKCGRDVAVRSLAAFVEDIEAEHAKDPSKQSWDCSRLDTHMKAVIEAKVEADPEVAALKERHAKACPPK